MATLKGTRAGLVVLFTIQGLSRLVKPPLRPPAWPCRWKDNELKPRMAQITQMECGESAAFCDICG
jgi:hypothetical protein